MKCFLLAAALAWAAPASAGEFLREDWIFTQEPTHPGYWGGRWAVNTFLLPFRGVQRAKHELETRLADNWRFHDGGDGSPGGVAGVALRLVAGSGLDFGLFMGTQNLHHVTGHDAAAREFARAYGLNMVPGRYGQVLPKYLGGGTLKDDERRMPGGGDAQTRYMSQPMESENLFAYEQSKLILAEEGANAVQVFDFLLYRGRFFMDRFEEDGDLSQDLINAGRKAPSHSRLSTDFTSYLYALNMDRYGKTRLADFKLTMSDIRLAYALQLLDPVFALALWQYGKDYLVGGKNRTHLPMIPLGRGWSYLPGLRVEFSPFGLEYYQDNFLRRGRLFANLYWTVGDNSYEPRAGGGFEVWGLRLWEGAEAGVFANLARQPHLTAIEVGRAPPAGEGVGRAHAVYDVGGVLKAPVWTFGAGPDPARLFLYFRGGTKNTAWFPGAYLKGGGYLQTGLGARL